MEKGRRSSVLSGFSYNAEVVWNAVGVAQLITPLPTREPPPHVGDWGTKPHLKRDILLCNGKPVKRKAEGVREVKQSASRSNQIGILDLESST